MKESSRHVEVVLRALALLECFEAQPLLQLKQISEMTGLHNSRVIRLCGTLVAKGYLAYDSETRKYTLGPRVFVLGKVYERTHSLLSSVRPIMRELANQTGESATLFVVDGLQRLCVAREEGTHSIRYNIVEGQRMVLYAGSGGKALLAFGAEALRSEVLKRDNLKKLTAKTEDNPRRLGKELEAIRRRGYATSFGERDAEVASLAAPVYDADGKVCAALSVAGPISRFSPEHNARHLRILLGSARRISQKLGYAEQRTDVSIAAKRG